MSADSECATCGAKPGEACFYQYPSDLHDRGSITATVTTDGIATGLSRALVALEGRARELALRDDLRAGETASCAKLVRELLEALVDGPTEPGEKLAQH